MTTSSLENKVCLIAGASGAIGMAVAKRLKQEGARLALTYGTQLPDGRTLDLAPSKDQLVWYQLDVTSWDQVESTLTHATEDLGGIDVLVNCTGVLGPIGSIQNADPRKWARTVEVNLVGSMYLARAVVPQMKDRRRGKIVFFSGGGAAYGRPFFTAYSSSKAGLVRFVESLAQELETANVQVNAVAPGPIESRMWEEMRTAGEAGGPKLMEELQRMRQSGGASPDRAAALTAFLASDRSGQLSGRLISAIWDEWENIDRNLEKIVSSEAWTLRRVPVR